MADVIVHGFRGQVDWSATAPITAEKITRWEAALSCDVADVSGMESAYVSNVKVAGIQRWTATVECAANDAAPPTAQESATAAILRLYVTQTDGDGYVEGTALCTGISQSQSQDDAGRITMNFLGSGAATWETAAP